MLALCALLVLAACKTTRRVTTDTVSHTETTVVKIPRDTLLPVPREAVHQTLPLPVQVPDVPPRTKTKGRATSTLSVLDGRVEADCVCDSDAIKARLWDTWTKEHQDTTVTTVTKVVKTRLPWWFYGALVLAALVALSRFYIKPF